MESLGFTTFVNFSFIRPAVYLQGKFEFGCQQEGVKITSIQYGSTKYVM